MCVWAHKEVDYQEARNLKKLTLGASPYLVISNYHPRNNQKKKPLSRVSVQKKERVYANIITTMYRVWKQNKQKKEKVKELFIYNFVRGVRNKGVYAIMLYILSIKFK